MERQLETPYLELLQMDMGLVYGYVNVYMYGVVGWLLGDRWGDMAVLHFLSLLGVFGTYLIASRIPPGRII